MRCGGNRRGACGRVRGAGGGAQGADTVLVSDRPVLGGNSSSEIRVWTRGATGGGNLFAEEMGIFGELKLRALKRNPSGSVLGWDDVLLDAVLAQSNLRLLLNTAATGVQMDGGRIERVALFSSRTQSAAELCARMVIDCTGDGAVGAMAGVPFRTGREGRGDLGEPGAQASADTHTLGCSILIQTKRMDHKVVYTAPDYAYTLDEVAALIGRGGRIVTADMQGSDCWWFEYGGQLDTIADDQAIAIELRRIAAGIFGYIKNSGHYDADNLALEWMGALPGKRASRRLIGDRTLVEQDVREDRHRDDAVCYGGWFMDSHPSAGIQSQKEECTQLCVPCYGIPLDCMFSSAFPNLFFAGRCASQSHVALTSARIMNLRADGAGLRHGGGAVRAGGDDPCGALAGEEGALLDALAKDDALLAHRLPPVQAAVTATATLPTDAPADGSLLPMDEAIYAAYPAACGAAELTLRAKRPIQVRVRRSLSPLPSRRCAQGETEESSWLAEGDNTLRIPAQGDEGFVLLRFDAAPGAALLCGSRRPGIQAGLQMEGEIFCPAIRAEHAIYAPEHAADGWLRPWNGVHVWAADGSCGALTMTWPQAVRLSGVSLYFDPDLSMELTSSRCERWDKSHHYAARRGMPESLVRSYRLLADTPQGVRVLAQEADNGQRLRVHRFEPTDVRALTLEITQTYGGNAAVYAVVPEIM